MIDNEDLDELLEAWYKVKSEIAYLERKCEKYKKYCETILDKKEIDILTGTKYVLKRTTTTRTSISKKDLPRDIWVKYSTKTSFNAYFLKPVNEVKKSRKKSQRSRKKHH